MRICYPKNNFHDLVNQDQNMYEAIDAIPNDQDDMVSAIIATAQRHVSEVWSPPRVTALAPEYGRLPGSAYDIETNDELGQPWDFDKVKQRNKCMRQILKQKPAFLVGSPMCTAFSILQGLNRAKMDLIKWEAMWNKGVRHIQFAIKLYRINSEAGRFFLHEHPASASSWKLPEMQSLMTDIGTKKVNYHMCHFKMMSEDEQGRGLEKNPTGFLTNRTHATRIGQAVPWRAQTCATHVW